MTFEEINARLRVCQRCERYPDCGESQRLAEPDLQCPSGLWDPPGMPSFWRQGLNLAGAVVRNAGAVLSGNPLWVPNEETDRRLKICEECPDHAQGRCAKCGCFMAAKARLAAERCPVGRWITS